MQKPTNIIFVLLLLNAFLLVIRIQAKKYFQPVAVIVPHHNIVADVRQRFFAQIASQRPETNSVIVLSPDHFSPDKRRVYYSDRDWQLDNGTLKFDEKLGGKFHKAADVNPQAVLNDHGIFNVLSDIKTGFPQSKIVPVIIGENVPLPQLDLLVDILNRNCLTDCLLVASVDFSHYLPADLADFHDLYSLKTLQQLDTGNYQNLEVDSPQVLYTVMQTSKYNKARTFNLFAHSNSGYLLNSPDAESTSHVFGFYSRNIRPKNIPEYQTFTLALNLVREQSQKGVGDRFFYGTDYVNTLLSEPFSPSPKFTIRPGTISRVVLTGDRLEAEIGPDLTVTGVVTEHKTTVLMLPLDASASAFLRGNPKISALKQLFGGISPSPGVRINYEFGIIDIEAK